MNEAQQIVGKQGKFEIPYPDNGVTRPSHVLYGDAITSVQTPTKDTSGNGGVSFTLSSDGARNVQAGCHQVRRDNRSNQPPAGDDPR